jgi:hypothetical protein
MKYIQLTNGYQALVDEEDYPYLSQFNWYKCRDGYAIRAEYLGKQENGKYKQKVVFMHHEILPRIKGRYTDHINRNTLDNRRGNLRYCTPRENNHNKSKQINNTSGFIGVTYALKGHGKPWKSYIYYENKRHHLGQFDTKEEAAYVRDQAALQLHGEFAHTNFEYKQ